MDGNMIRWHCFMLGADRSGAVRALRDLGHGGRLILRFLYSMVMNRQVVDGVFGISHRDGNPGDRAHPLAVPTPDICGIVSRHCK